MNAIRRSCGPGRARCKECVDEHTAAGIAGLPALQTHHAEIFRCASADLFDADPSRGERLSAEAAGLYLDYSKHRMTDETSGSCCNSPTSPASPNGSRPCSRGGPSTKRRGGRHSIPHFAQLGCRDPGGREDVVSAVHDVLDRMGVFADRVRSGAWTGHTAHRIRNVINIGIGGRDLGPAMAYEALRHYSDRWDDVPVRLFMSIRNRTSRRGHPGPRFRRDAGRRIFRDISFFFFFFFSPSGPTLVARCGWAADEAAVLRFRRRLDQRRRGDRVQELERSRTVRLLELGGRPFTHSTPPILDHFTRMLDGFHAMDEHFHGRAIRSATSPL